MNRREFIQNSGLSLMLAGDLSSDLLAAMKKKPLVSLQLYSVRAEMKKDPKGTIEALGKIGFKDCEHAGYDGAKRQFYGYTPLDFKKLLSDNGMTMQSGHTQFGKTHWDAATKSLTDLWKTTVEDAATVGQKYIISPWLDVSLRKNFDDLKGFMDAFNVSGAYCKSKGLKYGYHNHDFEFSLKLTSKRVYDIILENTDPNLVVQQLDIGNMYGGGGRAEELLAQYPGRFELMHVKNEIDNGKGGHESCVLDKGFLDTQGIVKTGIKSGGTKYLIIEQESYQNLTPLESMAADLALMKKWGY